eukprot:scaffold210929_cov50-Attheya_sp.AAC.5
MKIGGSYVMAVAAAALCVVVPSFGMRVRITERGTRVSRQATSSRVKRNFKVGRTDKKRRNLGGRSLKSAKVAKSDMDMFEEISQLTSAAPPVVMSTPETARSIRQGTSTALVRGARGSAQKASSPVNSQSREARVAGDEFLITPQLQCDTFTTFAETWFNFAEPPVDLCIEFSWMNPYLCFIDVALINNNQTLAEAYCASLFFESSGLEIPLGGDYSNFDCFSFCTEFIGSDPIDPAILTNETAGFTQGQCCTNGYYPRGDNFTGTL